ncbi:MAG TPA: MlaD family protein [Acidimicrobiales bacterium]|nr:MlaD family protein [Acidimicrobiales bacterium]
MIHDLPRRLRFAFGWTGFVLLAGLTVVALSYGTGYFDGGYDIYATFPSSSQGLYTDGGSDVKLRGVDIGTVAGIDLQDDGLVRIRLRIDEGIQVPNTVVASIEPLSVFGPKFIRLLPDAREGTGAPLREGDEIAETLAPVELTDILASATELFEQVDPNDLITIFKEIADGVGGLGDEIGRTIDASGELLDVGAAHVDDTRRFLADLAALATTLADHADDARGITDDLATLLPVVTEEPGRIDELLDATTAISDSFADLIEENGEELDATIRAVATFVDGVATRAEEIPDFLHLIDSFFGRLSDVIRFDAPGAKQMAGLRGFIALDPCLVYGLCLVP